MKTISSLGLTLMVFITFFSVADAATLYSQPVALSPGWNIVSTPRVLDSHSFSATENATNFDIYVLDASSTSGWATMASLGQSEFTPLYGYFINNKTGANQTLTFNYKSDVAPNDRLFNRSFTKTGWYSIGVATPTYAVSVGTTTADTNNPAQVLSALSGNYSTALDLTDGSYSTDQDSVAVAASWKATTAANVGDLRDLRETKGYAVYITSTSALYNGFQNNSLPECADGIDNDGDSAVDYPADPGCKSTIGNNESSAAAVTGDLAISMSSSPAAQNIVAGAASFIFANIRLDTSLSGEDMRVSSLALSFAGNPGDLSTCQLWDGSTVLNTGSNVPGAISTSAANHFAFDNSLVISKGAVKTIAVKCSVSSGASNGNTYKFGVDSSYSYTTTGVTSGASITPSVTTGFGSVMTVTTGSLAVSLDSSSPAYQVVAAGTTNVTVGQFKFHPTNEGVWLNKLGLTLTNTASSSPADIVTAYVYQGATQVGTATFTGTNRNATSTFSSPVLLAKDADTLITVKADFSAQGTSQPGTPGHLIAIDYNGSDATGQSSGSTIHASGSTSVAGVRVFKSYPIFTYSTAGATANNGVNDLLILTITAPAAGPVKLNKLTFALSTTTATLTAPTFTGPNGNVASSTNVALNAAGTAITAWFDSASNTADAEIPAGTSKTYTLRGTVSLTGTGTTGAVSTALKADTAYPSLSGFMATATALIDSNIVWSPNTIGTATVGDSDWTNGYGLGGCFTSAGLGNDCAARVISK